MGTKHSLCLPGLTAPEERQNCHHWTMVPFGQHWTEPWTKSQGDIKRCHHLPRSLSSLMYLILIYLLPYLFFSLQLHIQFHLVKIQFRRHLFQKTFLEVSHHLCSPPPMIPPASCSCFFFMISFHFSLNWTMVSCIGFLPLDVSLPVMPWYWQDTSVSILLYLHNTKSLIICWLLSVFPEKEEAVSPQRSVTGISGWGRPWAHPGRASWTTWATGSKRSCPQDWRPTTLPQMVREEE